MNSYTFSTHDDKFLITSYGNGWAYEVRCNKTDYCFFVQDHDADDMQRCTSDFEDTALLEEAMSVLGTKDRELDSRDITDDEREAAEMFARLAGFTEEV
mgnify:CR=1 FL=1